jgi:hypothetical protein
MLARLVTSDMRPAGRIRPMRGFNVAHEQFLEELIRGKTEISTNEVEIDTVKCSFYIIQSVF